MKKNNLLKTVLLLVFTILFLWSCRQESLYTDTKNNNNQKVHNKISLNTFKQETKVSKIEEFTVLKNSKSNGKDAGATSTFIIDSTSIYKLAVNNNLSTYSFRAYNIFESPNVLYNLVYHIKDGKTGYRIFKMEKDSAIPVYDSEIGAITIKKSSSKSISKTAGCTESIKIYIWDCKNGHDWEHCDHCKDCYDVSYYDVTYDCSGGLSGGSGTSTGTPPSNNAPQCGESNAGYSGVMLDPSGYYFDPNEPLSIDAEKLRASYAYNFWNQLDQNHQLWVYNGNIDTYRFILENYLNNYSTTNNTNNLNFANWGIDFFTQNPTTSLEQFQNWFVEGDQDFNRDLLKMIVENNHKIPQYTSSDFPGMNNGMPYNWWNDENYLNNMSLGFNNINLTKEEKKMCALFPLAAVMIFSNKDIALNEASSTFPNQIPHNNKADAFRHAFFNALNTRDVYSQFSTRGTFTFAKNIVRMFGIAHESEVPQELLLEKAMDLYNNEGGIEVCSTCNPLTNPTNLVKGYVLSLLNEGKLVHIWPLNNDQTIRPDSNIYPTNQH